MVFRDVEIAWNGCTETFPGNTHAGCWGQEEGGYGDGLGVGLTGGNWLFEHVHVHHNTQDGIDLWHARGDTTVVDAYLSPILRRYVEVVENDLLGDRHSRESGNPATSTTLGPGFRRDDSGQ